MTLPAHLAHALDALGLRNHTGATTMTPEQIKRLTQGMKDHPALVDVIESLIECLDAQYQSDAENAADFAAKACYELGAQTFIFYDTGAS
jgi:hypothetical protein